MDENLPLFIFHLEMDMLTFSILIISYRFFARDIQFFSNIDLMRKAYKEFYAILSALSYNYYVVFSSYSHPHYFFFLHMFILLGHIFS